MGWCYTFQTKLLNDIKMQLPLNYYSTMDEFLKELVKQQNVDPQRTKANFSNKWELRRVTLENILHPGKPQSCKQTISWCLYAWNKQECPCEHVIPNLKKKE